MDGERNTSINIPVMSNTTRYVTEVPVTRRDHDDINTDPFTQAFPTFRNLDGDLRSPDLRSPDFRSPQPFHNMDSGLRSPLHHTFTIPRHQNIVNLSTSPRQYGSLPRHLEREGSPRLQKSVSEEHHVGASPRPHPIISAKTSLPPPRRESHRANSPFDRTSSPMFDSMFRQQRIPFDEEMEKLKKDFFRNANVSDMNIRQDSMFPDESSFFRTNFLKTDVPDFPSTASPSTRERIITPRLPRSSSSTSSSSVSEVPAEEEWSVEFDLHDYASDQMRVTVCRGELVIKAVAHVVEGGRNITKEYSNAVQLPDDLHELQLVASLSAEGILTVHHRAPPSYNALQFEAERQC